MTNEHRTVPPATGRGLIEAYRDRLPVGELDSVTLLEVRHAAARRGCPNRPAAQCI